MIQLTNAVEWAKRIILSELKEQADVTCWLGGGCIRDYFSSKPISSDYDIFFPNETEYDKAKKYFIDQNCDVVWDGDNGTKLKYNNKTFDLVKIYFDNPQVSIDAFDFTISMFAIDTENVYYGESSFIDLVKKQLMINKITYPASTLKRALKYHKKGYSMCVVEIKKMVEAIQDMPKQKNDTEKTKTSGESIKPVNEKKKEDTTMEDVSGDAMNFFVGID